MKDLSVPDIVMAPKKKIKKAKRPAPVPTFGALKPKKLGLKKKPIGQKQVLDAIKQRNLRFENLKVLGGLIKDTPYK